MEFAIGDQRHAEDGGDGGNSLSLLQLSTVTQRYTDGTLRQSRQLNRESGQGRDGLREEYAFNQNHALKFPTESSSPDEVKIFLMAMGNVMAGLKMKKENIDGNRFLNLNVVDLERYGVSVDKARMLLERIKTAQAQADIRQSMAHLAKSRREPTGSSFLHDIVGSEGVLMITLDRRSERFNHSTRALQQIGINAVKVSAVDATKASKEELARGCPKEDDPGVKEWCQKPASRAQGRAGSGCALQTQQAIAASHRKALEQAKASGRTWTAVFEDDSVPAPVENWNSALRELWGQLPARVKFVRLGWCQLRAMDRSDPVIAVPYANASRAVLIQREGCCGNMFYDPGGCTTAYLVHKDALSDLLNLFPCCGPVDACYKWDFFKAWNPRTKHDRGADVMMSIDSHNAPLLDGLVEHHGLILQDRIAISTAQDRPGQ